MSGDLVTALMCECNQLKARLAEAEVRLALQPCGHPVCVIRCENPNAEQTSNWCGWCADIDRAHEDGFRDGVAAALAVMIGTGEGRR